MYAPSGQQRPERLKIWGLTRKKKILCGARSTGVKQGEETEVNMDTITDKKAEQLESQGLWSKRPPQKRDTFTDLHNAADKVLDDMGIKITTDDYRTWTMKKPRSEK